MSCETTRISQIALWQLTLAGSKDSSKGAVLERNDYAREF